MSNRVGKLFRRMARLHNRALKRFEISAVHANILATLWLDGDEGQTLTIGELQAILGLGSSTLTGAVDRMEAAGLLRRVPSPGDRRVWRLQPVEWPQRRREAMLEAVSRTEDVCFAALNAAERRELSRLLDKTLAGLAEVDDDGE